MAAAAMAARAVVAVQTVMPGRDGATYLWMADRIAAGEPAAAFATVFHPVYPLLVGGLRWLLPAVDSMRAGQVVASGLAALAVVPLFVMVERRAGAAAAAVTGGLFAGGLWLARYPAECMSEGPFHLWVATWAAALLAARPRPLLAGTAAALAYGTRPEGALLLLLGGWHCYRRGRLTPFAAAALPLACMVPLGYASLGGGWTLTPKAAFNYAVGAGGAADGVDHYLRHVLRVPGTAFEALGYLVLPAVVIGLVRHRRALGTDGVRLLLLAPFAVQLAVVPLLRSHGRFLCGFGILLLPWAGVLLASLVPAAMRLVPLVIVVLLPDLARLPLPRGQERLVLRQLGEHLRRRLLPGERIASDMPRLDYYAGQRPGPPRPILASEIEAACRSEATRFAAFIPERTPVDPARLTAAGFAPLGLPETLETASRARGIVVYQRRP